VVFGSRSLSFVRCRTMRFLYSTVAGASAAMSGCFDDSRRAIARLHSAFVSSLTPSCAMA
jgi:hypothetical protein